MWPAALIAAVIAMFLGASDSSRTPGYDFDIYQCYYPAATRLHEALSTGRVPLWNPEVGFGLDEYSGSCFVPHYPPAWIHALVSAKVALTLLVASHLLLASLGMYIFLRTIRLGSGTSALGALTYTYGIISESSWPPMMIYLGWLPWAFVGIELIGLRRRWAWLGLTMCLTAQTLGGYFQYHYYGLILLGTYAVVKGLVNRDVRVVFGFLLAFGVALTISGYHLVPFYLNFAQNEAAANLMDPEHPGLMTKAAVHVYDGIPPEPGRAIQEILSNTLTEPNPYRALEWRDRVGYLGPLMPLLVPLALIGCRRWTTAFFAIAMLLGLYLCLGYAEVPIPLYGFLARHLPLFGRMRGPSRLLLWSVFGASVLVAYGAEWLWMHPLSRSRTLTILAVMLAICLTLRPRFSFAYVDYCSLVQRKGLSWAAFFRELIQSSSIIRIVFDLTPFLLGMSVLVVDLVIRTRWDPRPSPGERADAGGNSPLRLAGLIAAFLLTAYGCWHGVVWICPFLHAPKQVVSGAITIQREHDDGLGDPKELESGKRQTHDRVQHRRLGTVPPWPGEAHLTANQLQRVSVLAGRDRLYLAGKHFPVMRNDRLPSYRTLPFYQPLAPIRYTRLYNAACPNYHDHHAVFTLVNLSPEGHMRLFDWGSVRMLVAPESLDNPEGDDWIETGRFGSEFITYENPRVVPRASLWDTFRVVGAEEALAELVDHSPIDRTCGVALEDAPTPTWMTQWRNARKQYRSSDSKVRQVEWIKDESALLRLRVSIDHPMLLVISDSYDRGWGCRVDGHATPILRANYLFRAVALGAGSHEVEFRYRPCGIEIGLGLTVAGLAMTLLVAGFNVRDSWKQLNSAGSAKDVSINRT